jgi:hypothetical protein
MICGKAWLYECGEDGGQSGLAICGKISPTIQSRWGL